jgi:pimeloyl-ACP methyl ester carboxylesterase
VVLVHGALDRGTAFLRATRHLRDASWWIYDRRGYGRSGTDEACDHEVHLADLEAVLELATDAGARPAVVVGHSLGGTLALAVAERRPDRVAAVVAYESPLSWLDWWPRRGPRGGTPLEDDPPEVAVERFMRRVAGDEAWEALPEATRQRRLSEGPTLVAELGSIRAAPPYDPRQVSVPAVVARGGEADEVRRRAASLLLDELPDATEAVLDGAGHGAHLSHPEAFADLVRAGIARAGSVAPPAL